MSHQAFADGEFDAVGGGHGASEDAEHLAGAPLDGKSHVVLRRASGAVNSARSMEKIRPLQTVLPRPTALRYQAEIRRSDLFWHLADLRPRPPLRLRHFNTTLGARYQPRCPRPSRCPPSPLRRARTSRLISCPECRVEVAEAKRGRARKSAKCQMPKES